MTEEKKLRHWLAEKILGHKIGDLEVARHDWIKDQLSKGNTVSIDYIATPVERITVQ